MSQMKCETDVKAWNKERPQHLSALFTPSLLL
jgi:hypothetical protein